MIPLLDRSRKCARNDIDEVIQADQETLHRVESIRKSFDQVKSKIKRTPTEIEQMEASFAYMENLFRTLVDYRKFFLHFFRYVDTGDTKSQEDYVRQIRIFKQTLETHNALYKQNLDFPAYNFTEPLRLVEIAERTTLVKYLSRVTIAILLAILLWIYRGRNRFDDAPITWSHYTMIILMFGALAFFCGMLFTAFRGWALATSFSLLSALYWFLVRVILPPTYKRVALSLWPALTLAILILSFFSIRGPMYLWYNLWTDLPVRTIFLFLFIFLLLQGSRTMVGQFRGVTERPGLRILFLNGALFIAAGFAIQFFGLEESVTRLNSEFVLLPHLLSLIHGITTQLNVPQELALYFVAVGVLMTLPFFFLRLIPRRP